METQPPMRPVELQILLALLGEPLHGYALVTAVRKESGGSVVLEPGNLYRRLHRLLAEGLVREGEDLVLGDDRRRYYVITPGGRAAVAAEIKRMSQQVEIARTHGLDAEAG